MRISNTAQWFGSNRMLATSVGNALSKLRQCGESRVLSITAAGNVRLGRLDFGHRVGAR